ncbi:MAG: PaaI family thioesterase [Aminobacteriaceae bacterium]
MEQLPRSKGCFVCGESADNPRSLGLDIFWNDEERRTEIPITPDATWCGYEGVVHGGVIASVFDDAMAWAVRCEHGTWAVTGEMSVRYLRPVLAGKGYVVEGRVEKSSGRRITTAAVMRDDRGKRVAEGTALFVLLPEKKEEERR